MTMAMLAAPQPSLGCLTNGTSSHTPGGPAANMNAERHSRAASLFSMKRPIELLVDGHDNQDQRGNGNNNPDQVAVTEASGGKVGLRLVCASCHFGQVLIAQGRHGILDLHWVHFGGLQGLFRRRRGEKLLHGLKIVLPRLAALDHFFLKVSGIHNVGLRKAFAGKEEKSDQRTCGEHTVKPRQIKRQDSKPSGNVPGQNKSITVLRRWYPARSWRTALVMQGERSRE